MSKWRSIRGGVQLEGGALFFNPSGALNSLRLILLEVILTNQFVSLFRQKTKIFVYQNLTNYFFNFKLKLKHLIQIE